MDGNRDHVDEITQILKTNFTYFVSDVGTKNKKI
jgi:hypothetical protein